MGDHPEDDVEKMVITLTKDLAKFCYKPDLKYKFF
jgi:hypothetical protein